MASPESATSRRPCSSVASAPASRPKGSTTREPPEKSTPSSEPTRLTYTIQVWKSSASASCMRFQTRTERSPSSPSALTPRPGLEEGTSSASTLETKCRYAALTCHMSSQISTPKRPWRLSMARKRSPGAKSRASSNMP